ncbi:MAG: T9SS type A sorting domain-containing protein [Bacteroidetes bacterium]|nr:T9SS type A sorting domain-containing protein [Bacteroidota bacterium]
MKQFLLKSLLLCAVTVAYFGTASAQSELFAGNVQFSPSSISSFAQSPDKITFSELIQDNDNMQVNVQTQSPTKVQVKYFNMTGNMAKQETYDLVKGSNELKVNTDNLDAGVYMVQFYSANGSALRRIVKN